MFLLVVVFLLNQQPAGEEAGSPPTCSTDCSPDLFGSVLACEACVRVCTCVCVLLFSQPHRLHLEFAEQACVFVCVSVAVSTNRKMYNQRQKCVRVFRNVCALCGNLITVSLVVNYYYCCFYAC